MLCKFVRTRVGEYCIAVQYRVPAMSAWSVIVQIPYATSLRKGGEVVQVVDGEDMNAWPACDYDVTDRAGGFETRNRYGNMDENKTRAGLAGPDEHRRGEKRGEERIGGGEEICANNCMAKKTKGTLRKAARPRQLGPGLGRCGSPRSPR